MKVATALNIISFLMGLAMVQSKIICEYVGWHNKVDALVDTACDIVAYLNAEVSKEGILKFTHDSAGEMAVHTLQQYNCKKSGGKVYFGLKICKDDTYSFFDDSIPTEPYLSSVETAMKYARKAGYDGFFVNLCLSNNPTYQHILINVLNKVKVVSRGISLPYGIRIFGRDDYFPLSDHENSADFFSVSLQYIAPSSRVPEDYNNTIDPTTILDFWSSKDMDKKITFFDISTVFPNLPLYKATRIDEDCNSNFDPSTIRSKIYNFASTLAQKLNNKGVLNVYVSGTDIDDVDNKCGNGTFPIINAIKAQLSQY